MLLGQSRQRPHQAALPNHAPSLACATRCAPPTFCGSTLCGVGVGWDLARAGRQCLQQAAAVVLPLRHVQAPKHLAVEAQHALLLLQQLLPLAALAAASPRVREGRARGWVAAAQLQERGQQLQDGGPQLLLRKEGVGWGSASSPCCVVPQHRPFHTSPLPLFCIVMCVLLG